MCHYLCRKQGGGYYNGVNICDIVRSYNGSNAAYEPARFNVSLCIGHLAHYSHKNGKTNGALKIEAIK
ncbi:hypothetical protein GCM10022210_16270 [Mucilaginibacter dorajii]|uniref:Uncharacterized protein n=1 Tax=Mucilaginibacter dorajii TaxID=692994 RepID=A0ABP7PP76_9SPHI